jgi:hypothetical protein
VRTPTGQAQHRVVCDIVGCMKHRRHVSRIRLQCFGSAAPSIGDELELSPSSRVNGFPINGMNDGPRGIDFIQTIARMNRRQSIEQYSQFSF